jgi:hypothetical protein
MAKVQSLGEEVDSREKLLKVKKLPSGAIGAARGYQVEKFLLFRVLSMAGSSASR